MADRDDSFAQHLGSFTSIQDEDLNSFLNSDLEEINEDAPIIKKEEKVKEPLKSKEIKENELAPKDEPLSTDELLNGLEDNEIEEEVKVKKEIEEENPETTFSIIAKELLDKGIFSLDEDEELDIKSDVDLLDRLDYEAKKRAGNTLDAFLNDKGEVYRNMFDAVFVKGVHPKDYLELYTEIEDLSNVDISSEENQERVVRQYYKQLGKSNADVRIERLKNNGEIEDEAKDALEYLVGVNSKKLAAIEAQKEQEFQTKKKFKDIYNNTINQLAADKLKARQFDGLPFDKKTADILVPYLTKDKHKDSNGNLFTDFDKDLMDLSKPENTQLKFKLALYLQTIKTDPSLSKLQREAVSKETNTLFNKLKSTQKRTTEQPSSAWD